MKVRRRLRFTLTEILIVIAIIGLVVAAMLPNLTGGLSEAQLKTTKLSMAKIGNMMTMFLKDHKRLPSSVDELVSDPGTLKNPYKPYAKASEVHDVWGNPFRIVIDSQYREGYDILSNGPDGVEGTEDDLSLNAEGAQ